MSESTLKGSVEENLLTMLVWNEAHASTIAAILPPALLGDRMHQKIAEVAIEYIRRFHHPPRVHIKDLLERELRRPDSNSRMYMQILDAMEKLHDELQPEYVIAELDKFIRIRRRLIAIDEAYVALQAGDEATADDAIWKQSGVSSRHTEGIWLHDTNLEFLSTKDEDFFSSGIESLDKAGVRPERGTLTLFIAPKKRGKCIDADELVLLPNGRLKRIEDVVIDRDPQVLSMTPDGELVVADITEHWNNGLNPCYMLITTTGRTMTTTSEHQYFTQDGWIPLEELQIGIDYVAVPAQLRDLGHDTVPEHEAKLLGYLYADGGLTKPYSTSFTKADPVIRGDFERCVVAMNGAVTWGTRGGHIVSAPKIRQWLIGLGMNETKSRDKRIPYQLFTWNEVSICHFLNALFSCDGSLGKDCVEISLANYETVMQIKHLLLRVGITSTVGMFTARCQGKTFDGYGRLKISGKADVTRFLDVVGFTGVKDSNSPRTRKWFDAVDGYGVKHRQIKWTDDIVFEQVKAIIPVGERNTYDLSIAAHHNFIAGDVVVHNSWSCVNIGKAGLRYRKKVLHITLENSEILTKRRYIQAFWSMTKRQIASIEVPYFIRDSSGEWAETQYDKQTPMALTVDNQQEIAHRLEQLQSRPGLLIKQFPSGSLTPAQLSAFLDNLERQHKFKPDLMIVDSPDLMAGDPKNLRIDRGRNLVSLRGIAVDRNIALYCTTQGNRDSEDAKVVRSTMIAEDWSQAGTADTILTFCRTPQEKARGLARIWVDASRDEEDGFAVMITQSYPIGQFCLDSVLMHGAVSADFDRMISGEATPTETEEE